MGQPGGAVLCFALGASLSGGIVSLRRADDSAWALDALPARGVDLAVEIDPGPASEVVLLLRRSAPS